MTHYRLNQPTAYEPVPGPPVNPTLEVSAMTTTETKAKRTGGTWEIRFNTNDEAEIWSGDTWIALLPHQCVVSLEELAKVNGDFIVHACNLHDEMVTMLECAAAAMEIEWSEDSPVVKRSRALLSRCQQT